MVVNGGDGDCGMGFGTYHGAVVAMRVVAVVVINGGERVEGCGFVAVCFPHVLQA